MLIFKKSERNPSEIVVTDTMHSATSRISRPAILVDCRNGILEQIGDESKCNAELANLRAFHGDASQRLEDYVLVTLYDKGFDTNTVAQLMTKIALEQYKTTTKKLFQQLAKNPERALAALHY